MNVGKEFKIAAYVTHRLLIGVDNLEQPPTQGLVGAYTTAIVMWDNCRLTIMFASVLTMIILTER